MNKKYLPCLLALFAMLVTGFSDAQKTTKTVDFIIAIVNDSVITRHELNEILQITLAQLKKNEIKFPPMDVLEKQLLERTITTRIQLQLAKEIGVTVSDNDLEQTLDRIAKGNNMSRGEFFTVLEKSGIKLTKFRSEIRSEMILSRLKDREVLREISITEEEINDFLRTQENFSRDAEEYQTAHIMIRITEEADASTVESRHQRAKAALVKLKNGAQFSQVAAEFSDAADAMEGGVLDWKPITQFPIKFASELKLIKSGELTPIMRSPSGFHIIQLIERRGKNKASVLIDQTQARHILIKVGEKTSESDAQQRIIDLKERLTLGADFSELARLSSEDTSSSAGGDLGWISPGDTVPEFENAMNLLQIGKVSDPVRSTFGWHLIQVRERRTKDTSDQRERQEARKILNQRKGDEAFQEWLQQLRDRAHIEYLAEEK